MPTDESRAAIEFAIRCTADRAWRIAADGGAPPEVCTAIEALSDDGERLAEVVAEVMAAIRRPPC